MNTKIILLSIFQLFAIQIIASSNCLKKRTIGKKYNPTAFVFVVDPEIAEKAKLSYVLAQLPCKIPKNPKITANFFTGEKFNLDVYDEDVFQQYLAHRNLDFCNRILNNIYQFIPPDSQLIIIKSKQDRCSDEFLENIKREKRDENVHLNFIILDATQITGYNSVKIDINMVDPTQTSPPMWLSETIDAFIEKIIRTMEHDYIDHPITAPPHAHNVIHHHYHHEALEPWTIAVIIGVVLILLVAVIVGTLWIRNKLEKEKKEEWKGMGSCSAEYELPKKKTKKLPKAPLPPSTASPSSYSGSLEVTKLSKEKSAKTKSTLSYSITLESVKSKKKGGSKDAVPKNGGSRETVSKKSGSRESASKKGGSKESGSKEGGSKESGSRETVGNMSAEKMEKTKMKTAEEPSKHKTSIITV